MDQAAADQVNKAKADLQSQIDDLKNKQVPVVESTPTNMRKVFYATQPVEAGAKISPAFYETKLTPNDVLPDAYGEGSDVVGFYAIRPIEKGDPLTPRNIGKTLPYLSQRIPAGMRALALPIFNADQNNTGGFVVDGDKVDLLFTVKTAETDKLIETRTILQSVQVLFVPGPPTRSDTTAGVMPAPSPGEPLSVTFLVTEEEAQALVFLSHVKNGSFSMILRGRTDVAEAHPKAFQAADYTDADSLKKIQKMVDKSQSQVDALQAKIQAEEQKQKDQAAQGNTNETTRPSQPSP